MLIPNVHIIIAAANLQKKKCLCPIKYLLEMASTNERNR